MRVAEWVAAAAFALLGVRSLVHWLTRPLETPDRRDRLLFSLFVMSRVGLWFAVAGLFALYASIDTRGRAFVDEAGDLRWYVVVVAVPAAGQFVTGFLLGRPRPGADPDA
jgi:hypothetical protein